LEGDESRGKRDEREKAELSFARSMVWSPRRISVGEDRVSAPITAPMDRVHVRDMYEATSSPLFPPPTDPDVRGLVVVLKAGRTAESWVQ
jgi:hypothetical protein